MSSAFNQGAIPPIEVRHRLRIAREYAGYDQGQLADLIGVSRNTISNAEVGSVSPRKIVVNAWAMACGVPADWLWTGEHGDGGPGPSSGLGIISADPAEVVSKRCRPTARSQSLKNVKATALCVVEYAAGGSGNALTA